MEICVHFRTVPPDFENCVRFRTILSDFGTCVNLRMVLSDFGNLRPFSNSTARLHTHASVLRQYRKTSNFLNRTAVVSHCSVCETFCSRTTWVNYSFTIILEAVPDSYPKIPQLKVLLLLTTGIIPSNNLSCDRKTFMTGFISTIICCGLVLFVDVVRGRL